MAIVNAERNCASRYELGVLCASDKELLVYSLLLGEPPISPRSAPSSSSSRLRSGASCSDSPGKSSASRGRTSSNADSSRRTRSTSSRILMRKRWVSERREGRWLAWARTGRACR